MSRLPTNPYNVPGAVSGQNTTALGTSIASLSRNVTSLLSAIHAQTATLVNLSTSLASRLPGGGVPKGRTGKMNDALEKTAKVLAEMNFSALGNQLMNLTRLADPGRVALLNYAIRDFQATIGRALLPLVQAATQGFQTLADVIFGLSPQAKEMVSGFAATSAIMGVVTGTLAAIRIAWTALKIAGGPVSILVMLIASALGRLFTSAEKGSRVTSALSRVMVFLGDAFNSIMEVLADALEPVANVVLFVIDVLADFVDWLIELKQALMNLISVSATSRTGRFANWLKQTTGTSFGLGYLVRGQSGGSGGKKKKTGFTYKPGQAKGAASLPFGSGSSDDIYRRNAAAAYGLSSNPAATTASNTTQLLNVATNINTAINNFNNQQAASNRNLLGTLSNGVAAFHTAVYGTP